MKKKLINGGFLIVNGRGYMGGGKAPQLNRPVSEDEPEEPLYPAGIEVNTDRKEQDDGKLMPTSPEIGFGEYLTKASNDENKLLPNLM